MKCNRPGRGRTAAATAFAVALPLVFWIEAAAGADLEAGRQKAQVCVACHGPAGNSINPVMKWGERLEYTAEAGPGDFIYIPPYVPHQEINASDEAALSCVLVRSGQEPVVVNLDIADVEPNPEQVHWIDNIHPAPK